MKSNPLLCVPCDVVGANVRLTFQSHAEARSCDIASYATFSHGAMRSRYDRGKYGEQPSQECAIGVADPIADDLFKKTNHHWSFSILVVLQRAYPLSSFAGLRPAMANCAGLLVISCKLFSIQMTDSALNFERA